MTPHRPAAGPEPDGSDRGFAMITVVGAMFVLTVFALASLSMALGGLPQSRRAQDSGGALAAAQAGVDDLLARVNACDTYWRDPSTCNGATPNAALDGATTGLWASVPGGDPARPARYRYRYLVTPEPVPGVPTVEAGLIRLESTGEVNGVRRTISVDLRKTGFLRFIYFTDIEAEDPGRLVTGYPSRFYSTYPFYSGGTLYESSNLRFAGVSRAQAEGCARHWYGATARQTTFPEAVSGTYAGSPFTSSETRSCDLTFAGGSTPDVVNGPLHSNDALLIAGGATFTNPTTQTGWPLASTPAPDPVNHFRPATAGAQPSGHKPYYAPRLELPPSGTAVTRDAALRGGCLYTGPTSITFLTDGRLRVHSPFSRSLSARCGGTAVTAAATDVDGPANGVVHVQGLGEDPFWNAHVCSGRVLGTYPATGDTTSRYDCRQGDAFVSGQVGRPLTVSAANNVVVVGNTTRVGGATGANVLGLVAKNFIEVYHPVGCSQARPAGAPSDWTCDPRSVTNLSAALQDVTIEAAILSLEHSFTVQHSHLGPQLGTLTVRGGIYQKYRGTVGSTRPGGAKTGYTKDYTYDPRLLNLPPPSFIEPKAAAWSVTNFSEQRS